jgi:NAD(P)-dependent dehydrogenase (short-subunit alcohol dehydrogenase family)
MRDALATNTAAPAAMVEAFKPWLKKSSKPRLLFVSSSTGSITLRGDPTNKYYNGSSIAYRVSKAALNMLTVCYAKQLKEKFGCNVWAVDPGHVVSNLIGDVERMRAVRKIKANIVCCTCFSSFDSRSLLVNNNLPLRAVYQNINLKGTRQVQLTYSLS